ncbi:hypothetical protein RND71_020681 [Anisodus tanguticus]|uniref:Neprosin PEP catalytic domain-containing protein n=1 Tax=Anisodus tanguticus TaxID=243964 RepID=A0AAE1RVY6_9SOLA|nr:hypothetical protein RND71_020681 [Anisodus tanguticus]
MAFKLIALLLLEIITFAPFALGENGLAIKSIQSEDGDVIDCIDIFKQPALYHPALKNHKIQMTPSYNAVMETTKTNYQEESYKCVTTQTWQKNGSCPKGTIPIRRTQKNIKKDQFKKHSFFHLDKGMKSNKDINLSQKNHSLAILHTEGFRYLGAKTDMKTWNPHVEEDDEYSTSRLALQSGAYYDYQNIESGWAVNPRVYGDRQTRFFTYWTDLITSNWWLNYGESINIGYWPSEIFEGGLQIHAETVQWGGEVYSKHVGTHPHTKTQMGSGAFPVFIFANTGFMKNMRVLDNTMELRFPQNVDAYSEEYDCYRPQYMGDYVEEPEFHFGGPGRNPICP